MQINLPSNLNKTHLALIVFGLLIAVFYGNALFGGFILDDKAVIRDNPYVQSLKYTPKIITGCIWEYVSGGCKGTTLHYRPLHSLSYLITYQISSSPWFFHLINLLYFFIAVSLVFILAKALTKKFVFSFLAALFFLIHPINNEVVNWIAAATDLILAIFTLLAAIYYFRYRSGGSRKNLLFVLLFYFLALLSKETAIVLPLMILSMDLLLFKTPIREIFTQRRIKEYLLFAIPLFVYFLMRFSVVGGFKELTGGREYFGGFYPPERVHAFFKLFATYIGRMFYPYPLIFLHQFKVKSELFTLEFIQYFALFLAFLGAICLAVKKNKNLFAFTLSWFLIFQLPALLLFWAAGGNVYTERYLFVSSIGFSFLVAHFFAYLWQTGKKSRIIALIILLFIVAISFWVIYPRNKIWKDDITFFRATLALNPEAHHIRESLAVELRVQGDIEASKAEYEELIRRNIPERNYDISNAYNALGSYYREKGDFDNAQQYFEKSIAESEKTRNYRGYNNLGALYMEKERYLQALIYFCQAFKMAPDAPEPNSNFQRVASMISSVEDESFIFLYMDIMDNEEFKKSEFPKIKHKRTTCAYNNCLYVFLPELEINEILLPFLITAKVFPEEIVRIKDPIYNPKTNEITLQIDEKYVDRLITFNFPTCEGLLYQIEVVPEISNF